MTTKIKTRWPLAQAEVVAHELIAALTDVCERIEVAGSIRRRKPDVGDIELVLIPRWEDHPDFNRPLSMFATEKLIVQVDMVDERLRSIIDQGVLSIRGGYGARNKFLRHVASGIPIDVFTADARNWGMSLMVRTGSAEFNIAMMGYLRSQGHEGHAYGGITVHAGGGAYVYELECPDEDTIWQFLGIPPIPPPDRDGDALRRALRAKG